MASESAECDDDPRISLSDGFLVSLDSSQHAAAAEAGGSPHASSEFEFLAPTLSSAATAAAAATHPHLQRSPSISSADRLFCNGRLLPLHQTQPSHRIKIADLMQLERRPADQAAAAAAAAAASVVSRHLKEMQLKPENPKPQKRIQSINCSARVAAARSLWFLRRCRSTNDKEDPHCCSRSVDPWLGRSASDSRMNPLGGGGGASRQAFAKPNSKSFGKSDSFRSYAHVLSRKSTSPRKGGAAMGSRKRWMDATETRDDSKNAMKDSRPLHASKASKTQPSLHQGINVPRKRAEFWRSRSQKCAEQDCGSSSGRQAVPVVNVQICTAQSFFTPNARLSDLCNLSFLKKNGAQKQQEVGDSAS